MRWRSETWTQYYRRVEEWHQWFAWRPVKDREHGYRMWMETVLCRRTPSNHYKWEYRPLTLLESDVRNIT